MNGYVDDAGRALLELRLQAATGSASTSLTVWIDTAFTGELVVPRTLIKSLGLSQSAAVMAGLADGSQVVLETFTCVLDWDGTPRIVEVIANDGQFPLLGVGLLQDRRLEVDYPKRIIELA
jgi:clan AA aspartic protease